MHIVSLYFVKNFLPKQLLASSNFRRDDKSSSSKGVRKPLKKKFNEDFLNDKSSMPLTTYNVDMNSHNSSISNFFCCVEANAASKKRPFNLIQNKRLSACWLICIIHCIRSNTEFKKYIFENWKNEQVKQGLRNLLNIHRKDISKKNFDLLTSFDKWRQYMYYKGNHATFFLVDLIKSIELDKKYDCKYKNDSLWNVVDPFLIRGVYTISNFDELISFPLIRIDVLRSYPIDGYINVANAILGRPNISQIDNTDLRDNVVFNYKPQFLIVSLENVQNKISGAHTIDGIIIEKDVLLHIKGKNVRQKYSLTGMTKSSLYFKIKRPLHTMAIIKKYNKWYDTDYETYKDQLSKVLCASFWIKESPLINELDTKDRLLIDFKKHPSFYVELLFYQIVD